MLREQKLKNPKNDRAPIFLEMLETWSAFWCGVNFIVLFSSDGGKFTKWSWLILQETASFHVPKSLLVVNTFNELIYLIIAVFILYLREVQIFNENYLRLWLWLLLIFNVVIIGEDNIVKWPQELQNLTILRLVENLWLDSVLTDYLRVKFNLLDIVDMRSEFQWEILANLGVDLDQLKDFPVLDCRNENLVLKELGLEIHVV